jgi:hypothetical protein
MSTKTLNNLTNILAEARTITVEFPNGMRDELDGFLLGMDTGEPISLFTAYDFYFSDADGYEVMTWRVNSIVEDFNHARYGI